MSEIPFNRPSMTGAELRNIAEAIERGEIAAGGHFTRLCAGWLEDRTGADRALLLHSCTAALEASALLLELEPGDEVIMPSFTFVSTANAFVLRGAVPVFVDIRSDTLNVDETKIEIAITPRTRAIVVVHYAGVPCEMDAIRDIAGRHHLPIVEDAAQALLSTYRGRAAGTLGDLGAISFHETKNVTAGEGGALLVGNAWAERAEIFRDKGTNRSRFFRGEVDKYSWVDLGSSFGLSELNAAFLWAQFEHADALHAARRSVWDAYNEAFKDLEEAGVVRRPVVPTHIEHNAHLYYLLLPSLQSRTDVLSALNRVGVNAVFHFVPLHASVAGRRFGRAQGQLVVTERMGDTLFRLPLWNGITEAQVEQVIGEVYDVLAPGRQPQARGSDAAATGAFTSSSTT